MQVWIPGDQIAKLDRLRGTRPRGAYLREAALGGATAEDAPADDLETPEGQLVALRRVACDLRSASTRDEVRRLEAERRAIKEISTLQRSHELPARADELGKRLAQVTATQGGVDDDIVPPPPPEERH